MIPNVPDLLQAAPIDMTVYPEAGTYWRTRSPVPERRESAGDRSWLVRHSLPEDLMLLVKSVQLVEGEIHTIVLAPHPASDGKDILFLLDEFLMAFEKVDAPEEVRAKEIASLGEQIAVLQQEIVEGPPGLPTPQRPATPDVTALVKVAGRIEEMERAADRQIEVAQLRAKWIEERAQGIAGLSTVLMRFHSERAQAAISGVENTVRQVERLKRSVRSLRLYTGEGVDVDTLLEGESAPSSEPLTIYQQRLYLDEELAVMLADGGIDADSFQHLAAFIRSNPQFVQRVAPALRSVVMMNLRRTAKVPADLGDITSILDAIDKMREDTAAFLLIRNGGNVHIVWSDLLWSFDGKTDDFDAHGLKRLFPSRNDLDQPFRGVHGQDITPESLGYTAAKEKFEDRSLVYKRLLILLWGLNDRLKLFGDFYDQGRFATWADLEFQSRHFRFLADEETGLPENRLPVNAWVKERNGFIGTGSRVLCLWPQLFDEDTAPSCFRYNFKSGRSYALATPLPQHSLEVVKVAGGKPYVSVPVRVDNNDKIKAVRVDLAPVTSSSQVRGALCLDDVSMEELDRYIDSRRDRRQYGEYLWLFVRAREVLRQETAAQKSALDELSAAWADLRVDNDKALEMAVSTWRAAHRWSLVPTRGENAGAHREILKIAFALAGKEPNLREWGEDITGRQARVPVALRIDGRGRRVLYSEPLAGEIRAVVGPHVWCRRTSYSAAGSALGEFVELLPATAAERTLVEYPAYKRWAGLKAPGGLSYGDVNEIISAMSADAGAADHMFISGVADEAFFKNTIKRINAAGTKTRVGRVYVRALLGVASFHGAWKLVMLEEDPVLVHARSGDEGMARVLRWVQQTYRVPGTRIEEILRQAASGGARMVFADVADWGTTFRRDRHAGKGLNGLARVTPVAWRQDLVKECGAKAWGDASISLADGAEEILDAIAERQAAHSAV